MSPLPRILALVVLVVASASPLTAADESPAIEVTPYQPWPEAVVRAVRQIPVQNEGRIKPLSTSMDYFFLRLHGKRSIEIGDHRVEPTAVFLDLVLRPRVIIDVPLFQIQDSAAAEAVGLDVSQHKKRDRYSLRELMGRRNEIHAMGQQILRRPKEERSLVDAQVVTLYINLRDYELLYANFLFLETAIPVAPDSELGSIIGPGTARFSDILLEVHQLIKAAGRLEELLRQDNAIPPESRSLFSAFRQLATVMEAPDGWPRLWPPLDPDEETWHTTKEFVPLWIDSRGDERRRRGVELMERWEDLAAAGTEESRIAAAQALRDHAVTLARERGVEAAFLSEEAYHRSDLVFRSLLVFLLGFVVVCILWLLPRVGALAHIAFGITALAELVLIADVTWRCILRGRPPVTTLYETILFITGVVVLLCLLMELINRKRIAVSLGALLGVTGLFVARSYEVADADDTMPQLQAVLDTNFWLSTHVTTVTMGYAAGLLAAALAHVAVVARLVAPRDAMNRPPAGVRLIDRMIYGVTAFGVVFATVGTILGGIWANDSWGRFWGWDPKENGALMIVLAQLAMLHGRMAGILRGPGFAAAAIATGIIVAFSWWQVNLLGVGLHSYGHTTGVQYALNVFYLIETLFLILALIVCVIERLNRRPPGAVAARHSARDAAVAQVPTGDEGSTGDDEGREDQQHGPATGGSGGGPLPAH